MPSLQLNQVFYCILKITILTLNCNIISTMYHKKKINFFSLTCIKEFSSLYLTVTKKKKKKKPKKYAKRKMLKRIRTVSSESFMRFRLIFKTKLVSIKTNLSLN